MLSSSRATAASHRRKLPPRLKPFVIACAAVQLLMFVLFEHARGRFFVDPAWPGFEVNLVNGGWAGATMLAYGRAVGSRDGGRLRRSLGVLGRCVVVPVAAVLFCGTLSDLGVPYALHALRAHPVQLLDTVSAKVIVRNTRVPDSPELHGRMLDERYGLGVRVPWAVYDAASIGQPMRFAGRESTLGLWVDGKDVVLEAPAR